MNYRPQHVLKYCPKCGDGRFVFDGFRAFKCGACQFHFFINSAAAVAGILINDEGELLLTVRAFEPQKGCLDLPGGFVDPLETAELALMREIKEELNLDVVSLTYLTSSFNEYIFSEYSVYTTDLGFVCVVDNWDALKVADDVSGFVFSKVDAIDFDKIGSESMKQLVRAYQYTFTK